MAAPLLKDIETQTIAINQLASNPNQADAAKLLGVSEPTMSRFKVKHQEAIQVQAEKYLASLPSMVDQDIEEISEAKQLSKNLVTYLKDGSKAIKDKDGNITELFPAKEVIAIQKFLEYTDKKVTDIKRSVGIYSSHTPAMIFQTMNIYNDNKTVINPEVMNLLSGKISELTDDDDVIEVDSVDR